MLRATPLITVDCHEECDYCQQGQMIATTREPDLKIYPHQCNACHQGGLFKKPYPYQAMVNLLDFLSDSKQVVESLKAERKAAEQ